LTASLTQSADISRLMEIDQRFYDLNVSSILGDRREFVVPASAFTPETFALIEEYVLLLDEMVTRHRAECPWLY